MTPWTVADRISDRIIDILNEELKKPDFDPVEALAGQLLALFRYMRTAPPDTPASFQILKDDIQVVLGELMAERDSTPNQPTALRANAENFQPPIELATSERESPALSPDKAVHGGEPGSGERQKQEGES